MITFLTICMTFIYAFGLKVGLSWLGFKAGYLTCLLLVSLYTSMNRLSTFVAMNDYKNYLAKENEK